MKWCLLSSTSLFLLFFLLHSLNWFIFFSFYFYLSFYYYIFLLSFSYFFSIKKIFLVVQLLALIPDSLWSDWRGGLVRGQALPCMERQDWAGGFSQKENTFGGTLGNSPAAQVQYPLHLAANLVIPGKCGGVVSPNPQHPGNCTPQGGGLRPQAPRRCK